MDRFMVHVGLSERRRDFSCISSITLWCGCVQETFDVRGAFWWLRWLLPSFGGKLGSCLHPPTSPTSLGSSRARRSGASQLQAQSPGL